jgi:nitric oxide reductase subunit B
MGKLSDPAASLPSPPSTSQEFSPWWRYGVLITFVVGFGVLVWISVGAYKKSPPIPDRVLEPGGAVLFTGDDIRSGQEVFLSHGLMDNGSIWGHGAVLGLDYSAAYLHNLVLDAQAALQAEAAAAGTAVASLDEATGRLLSHNRYDPATRTLAFTSYEAASYQA